MSVSGSVIFREHLDFSDFFSEISLTIHHHLGANRSCEVPIIWPFEKMLNNYICIEIQMYKIRISAIRELAT